MPLTTAQKQSLKADIIAAADQACVDLEASPTNSDLAFAVATLYNAQASPAFTVWKRLVTITEVGDKINGTELAGLSSLNATRLQTVVVLSAGGVNPSLADRRQFFDDIFSGAGGATTRANLLALWKRTARRIEKVLATGTGSDASPATMGYEGTISFQDVLDAMAS